MLRKHDIKTKRFQKDLNHYKKITKFITKAYNNHNNFFLKLNAS